MAPAPRPGTRRRLPDDTPLWVVLQQAGGGTWGGAVFDVDRIVSLLDAGRQALEGR